MRHPRRPRLLALFASMALLGSLIPLDAQAASINLGLDRPVTSSGSEATFADTRAFDGDAGPADPTPSAVHNDPAASRWSGTGDVPWIAVDFGAPATIQTLKIRWGNTYATSYSLFGSADGATWTSIRSGLTGVRADWTTDTLGVTGHRHLKVQVDSKSATWPVSIWEIEAMGTLDGEIVVPVSVDVIPKPASVVAGDGEFTLAADTAVVASGAAAPAAELFAQALRRSSGYALPVVAGDRANAVSFALNAALTDLPGSTDEGYRLTVTPDGVSIEAPQPSGLFYGAQTLLQLLGPWARSATPVAQDWTVPAVDIADGPRYGFRGFMLDVSRSFVPKDEVKQILDEMAAHKLNVLHWHLSDDQGWRIAISNDGRAVGDDIDYTQLAEKSGATAVATTQWTQLPGRTGFYTAADFAELVRYAADRHIAVVPEIDGPAHSNAILHAIPQLNSAGSFPKVAPGETAPPITNTSVGDSSLDANNPATYVFMRHVFKQLIEANSTLVHGQRYLHIGGDESFNTSDADYLTYMERVTDVVTDLGAIPMAWNEAANHAPAQLPDGSVIHHWVGGVSDTARTLVNTRGFKMLMSPAANAYLPQRPGAELLGPSWACGTACDIQRFYNWDPTVMAGVPEASVLGVNAPIWSEHIRSLGSMEYLLYPRLMATAEVGWTPQGERNLADFRDRVTTLGTALTVSGRNFYPGDGTWELDVRGRALPVLQPADSLGLVGWASLPKATAADITATLQVGDDVLPLEVAAERPYLDGAGADFDHRQVNSIFELSTTASLPVGTHSGTLTVTAKGETRTATVPVTVEEKVTPSPSPSPSASPSAKPSVTPSVKPSSKPTTTPARPGFVRTAPYTLPGKHLLNGRQWMTTCEAYSQTERCRTEIWATVVKVEDGQFVRESGWAFNNLTYLPFMTREAWKGNPLGAAGEFTSGGRQWRTECDTAATGRGACRSYTLTTVYAATPKATGGYAFSQENDWVFNNIVMFAS